MSDNDIHGIQKGWTVKSLDGQNVGSVEETTETYILVKAGLLGASHRYLPAATLEHVRPELGEIGIDMFHAQVEEGDWSEPPTGGPRSEGAPLNVDTDAEADVVMDNAIVEPERPDEDVVHRT